jgi:periplasmic iron binding protein
MNRVIFALVAIIAATAPVSAAEIGIGPPIVAEGLIVRPVYLQPVHMAPMMPGMNDNTFDAHLELDIHADKNNRQGFEPGAWVPYLTVSYELQKLGSSWSTVGTLMAMTASDGPHYGANIKFNGPGKYRLRFRILPPSYAGFQWHTDKETGVSEWWNPIEKTWDFAYVGVGHKGGY